MFVSIPDAVRRGNRNGEGSPEGRPQRLLATSGYVNGEPDVSVEIKARHALVARFGIDRLNGFVGRHVWMRMFLLHPSIPEAM